MPGQPIDLTDLTQYPLVAPQESADTNVNAAATDAKIVYTEQQYMEAVGYKDGEATKDFFDIKFANQGAISLPITINGDGNIKMHGTDVVMGEVATIVINSTHAEFGNFNGTDITYNASANPQRWLRLLNVAGKPTYDLDTVTINNTTPRQHEYINSSDAALDDYTVNNLLINGNANGGATNLTVKNTLAINGTSAFALWNPVFEEGSVVTSDNTRYVIPANGSKPETPVTGGLGIYANNRNVYVPHVIYNTQPGGDPTGYESTEGSGTHRYGSETKSHIVTIGIMEAQKNNDQLPTMDNPYVRVNTLRIAEENGLNPVDYKINYDGLNDEQITQFNIRIGHAVREYNTQGDLRLLDELMANADFTAGRIQRTTPILAGGEYYIVNYSSIAQDQISSFHENLQIALTNDSINGTTSNIQAFISAHAENFTHLNQRAYLPLAAYTESVLVDAGHESKTSNTPDIISPDTPALGF